MIKTISLNSTYIDEMLLLQDIAHKNGDPFTPSSRIFYERAFMFQNFVFGLIDDGNDQLVGYCNCSVPTDKARKNLGRGIIPNSELDAVGHVNTILVDARYRRQGYGFKLLNQVIITFKSKSNIHYIFTTLYTINTPSHNLFLKCGFNDHSIIENNGVKKNLLLMLI